MVSLSLHGAFASNSSGQKSGLEEIFEVASKSKCPARFLRLDGPPEFREKVIEILDNKPTEENSAYKLLLDKNIPEIEFIFNNPFSEPFLSRMDAERHQNWETWRIKDEVLDYAAGLLKASQHRTQGTTPLSEIKVAFHSTDLLWNLGIAEGNKVIVRAYYQFFTGHSLHIKGKSFQKNEPEHLEEAFESYFRSVKNDSRTTYINKANQLKEIGIWPSLFKGNAILTSEKFSKTKKRNSKQAGQVKVAYKEEEPSECMLTCKWIKKACVNDFSEKAEKAWLSYKTETIPTHYFHPVRMCKGTNIENTFRAESSCLHEVEGLTAAEFLWHIQKVGKKYPNLIPKLEVVAGAITFQAFQALEEFRRTSRKTQSLRENLKIYPWAHQLSSAIQEAGRFVIRNKQKLIEIEKEVRDLGKALESYANVSFRDAHLKNRMIAIEKDFTEKKFKANNYSELRLWIESSSSELIFDRLKATTYDIDFETCFWQVSEWDDYFHIIWSTYFGYKDRRQLVANLDKLAQWWTPNQDDNGQGMWMTLLARSLREYCRRLWYDHVMPETYKKRYSKEKRDLFLELALAAVVHVNGCTQIGVFLNTCASSKDSIWNYKANKNMQEKVKATFPSGVAESHFNNISRQHTNVMLLDKNEIVETQTSFKSQNRIDVAEIADFATWSEKIDEALEKSKTNPVALDALKPILLIFSQMKTEMECLNTLNNEYLNKEKTPKFWTLYHNYYDAYNERASQLKVELFKTAIEKVKDENDKKSLWQKAEEINKKTKHAIRANREYILLFLEIITKFIPK